MVKGLLERWPLVRQLRTGADGTGVESMSERTRNLLPKNHDAEFTRAMCPYCGVGCGQMIYHKNGELVSIEGDPASPISRGHLCPKGADTYELHTHANRLMTVKVVDMPEKESDELLNAVYDHAEKKEFVYAHQWRLGDLLLWDNRCSSHARTDFPSTQRRLMLRTTVKGSVRPF